MGVRMESAATVTKHRNSNPRLKAKWAPFNSNDTWHNPTTTSYLYPTSLFVSSVQYVYVKMNIELNVPLWPPD